MTTLLNNLKARFSSDDNLSTLKKLKEASKAKREDICSIETEVKLLRKENERLESLVRAVVDSSPDMLWAKDLGPNNDGVDGRFIFTNKALREGLLISPNLHDSLNKPDIFFAQRQKDLGEDFTFGQVCANSDIIVLERNKGKTYETSIACDFLESGKVNGEYKRLMVIKKPFFAPDGKTIIGTCGTGRDVTEAYSKLNAVKLHWKQSRGSDNCIGEGIGCTKATEALQEFMDMFVFTEESGIKERL